MDIMYSMVTIDNNKYCIVYLKVAMRILEVLITGKKVYNCMVTDVN